MILQRRKFITGLATLIAAPAIVRVQNIMPVKALPFSISMRAITEYTGPFEDADIDILYGYLLVKEPWMAGSLIEKMFK